MAGLAALLIATDNQDQIFWNIFMLWIDTNDCHNPLAAVEGRGGKTGKPIPLKELCTFEPSQYQKEYEKEYRCTKLNLA